jgi:hypothetical protein
MRTRKILNRWLGAITTVFGFIFTVSGFGQTNLNFNAISATPEGSIQISWNSTSNETYEIDEADALGTNADGSTQWNPLYTEYPSQGTNTFWLDTGNYNLTPSIVSPRFSTARFYRIFDAGPDSTSDEPAVIVTTPTSGSVVSNVLTVTVSASTDQVGLSTLLYVDGQEMQRPLTVSNSSSGGTNYSTATYSLNTCEWLNGDHTIFATARCTSTPEGPDDNGQMLIGHAVSPMVPVTFSNLITGIAFTQPFFDPTLGQTQEVTAVFAANVNWTLQIQDANTNTVRTVTGSGGTMLFDWDGTDDGGTNLPAGVYTYNFSAETNGMALPSIVGGGSGGGSPPSPDLVSGSLGSSDVSQWWVEQTNGVNVPFAIFPPGIDTNDLTLFEEPLGWSPNASSPSSSRRSASVLVSGGEGFAAAYSGGSSQGSQAPTRPPTAPVRGTIGTVGVAYQTYSAHGSNGFNVSSVPNGIPGGLIQMQGHPANTPLNFGQLLQFKTEANNFITAMKKGAWNNSFLKVDDQITISQLSGAGTPFNSVNLGVLMVHGEYGTSQDFTESGCKQMYFPISSGGSAQYIRMSQMNFGGAGTNGLKWMAINACFSLYHTDWSSMQSQHIYPYNSNLHMLLGADTLIYTDNDILADWAQNMLGDPTTFPPTAPETIQHAWYDAGIQDFGRFSYPGSIYLATAGDSACQSDSLQTNAAPTGSPFYDRAQVY